MVLVAVGNEKGLEARLVVFEVRVVGNDVVDPREIGFREADPGIDQYDRVTGFEGIGILPDFPETPERKDIDRRIHIHVKRNSVAGIM